MSKDNKQNQERVEVAPYGDQKIAEALGYLKQVQRDTDITITKVKAETDSVEN